MKFTANLTLIILVIPLFLTGLILGTVRFQLLEPDFWHATFRTNNVYPNLATALKSTIEQETVKKGGGLQEVRVLTSLITSDNLQGFIEKNIENFLDFANGKVKEAVVFIPIKVLPKGLLPTSLGKITENTPLVTLLSEFHILALPEAQIKLFSKTGQTVGFLLTLDAVLIVLILIGFFFLAGKGKRFTAPATAFIASGILTLIMALFGYAVRSNMLSDWVKSPEPVQIILSPFLPYVLGEVLKVWMWFGIFAIAAGIALLFFRKNRFYD